LIALTVSEIAKAVEGELLCGDPNMLIDKVTTDSREKDGGLFVALKGENHDAHNYIEQFFENGGRAVISHKRDVKGDCVILFIYCFTGVYSYFYYSLCLSVALYIFFDTIIKMYKNIIYEFYEV